MSEEPHDPKKGVLKLLSAGRQKILSNRLRISIKQAISNDYNVTKSDATLSLQEKSITANDGESYIVC